MPSSSSILIRAATVNKHNTKPDLHMAVGGVSSLRHDVVAGVRTLRFLVFNAAREFQERTAESAERTRGAGSCSSSSLFPVHNWSVSFLVPFY